MKRLRALVPAGGLARLGVLLIALWKLVKHPRTPLAAKVVAGLVIAYAVSPIDLIPDFIPVLGQLDDLIIVPLGVALAIRLTPRSLWQQMLQEAEATGGKLPKLLWGAVLIVLVWLLVAGLFGAWLVSLMASQT